GNLVRGSRHNYAIVDVSTNSNEQIIGNALGNGTSGTTFNRAKSYPLTTISGNMEMVSGAGTPESNATASTGALFQRNNGGYGNTLYVKESGSATTTGRNPVVTNKVGADVGDEAKTLVVGTDEPTQI